MTPDLPRLAPRKADSHKGDFGRVLIVGGSRSMAGAAGLAGIAALRGGAGLVQLAVPEVCADTVASFEPSYMTQPLPCDREGRLTIEAREPIAELARRATVLAVGPGLGQSAELTELVAWMYTSLPLTGVFDADALNALAGRRSALQTPAAARLLTPHPGEFKRLGGNLDRDADRHEQEGQAVRLAAQWGAVIVLKGHHTLITDGRRSAHNATGNPGMATGGTGDVLTGVLAALLAQRLAPYEAARLGTHVHGLAGDLAAEQLGQVSLIASDLLRFLADAFRTIDAA
ncbi:MAG: NAD(P)H-hydrate dehydratase [Pirellulales bacterium]